MYFSKDEVIELNNNKKYLIIDNAILNDTVYYKIREYTNNELLGDFIYITTINREGKIYINEKLSNSELEKVKELFES